MKIFQFENLLITCVNVYTLTFWYLEAKHYFKTFSSDYPKNLEKLYDAFFAKKRLISYFILHIVFAASLAVIGTFHRLDQVMSSGKTVENTIVSEMLFDHAIVFAITLVSYTFFHCCCDMTHIKLTKKDTTKEGENEK